jgi:hypothetical protein
MDSPLTRSRIVGVAWRISRVLRSTPGGWGRELPLGDGAGEQVGDGVGESVGKSVDMEREPRVAQVSSSVLFC